MSSAHLPVIIFFICSATLGFLIGWPLGRIIGKREAENNFCDKFLDDNE